MSEVSVRRVGEHEFVARNGRGAEVAIGRAGAEGSFSPVELLLAAAAGCVSVTAEELITRRVGLEPDWTSTAIDVRPAGAPQLDGVRVDLRLDAADLADERVAALVEVVDRAVAALCTVTRTLKRSTETELRITRD